jgi:hypothetical protein
LQINAVLATWTNAVPLVVSVGDGRREARFCSTQLASWLVAASSSSCESNTVIEVTPEPLSNTV